jgi:hypothetical protein
MAQFSVKIIRLNGAVLDENQHFAAKASLRNALARCHAKFSRWRGVSGNIVVHRSSRPAASLSAGENIGAPSSLKVSRP